MAHVRERVRRAAHWGVMHGVPRLAVWAAARKGDLQGRLIVAGTGGADVFGVIEEIRAAGPITGGRNGWVSVDHAVVREVLTSQEFSSGNPVSANSRLGSWAVKTSTGLTHPLEPPSLLVTEPPEHTRYRKLVTRVFTVKAVEQLRTRTQEIADDLLDRMQAQARAGRPVDLVADYCSLLPVNVIAEILGVPDQDRGFVLDVSDRGAAVLDFGLGWRRYLEVDRSVHEFDAWLTRHIDHLRQNPGDNLLSRLIEACDEEGRLTEQELKSTAGLLLVAGFETTVNLLGNGIRLLSEQPEQLRRLRREPELWPNAVDEILRFDPPVLLTGRMTPHGATVAGRALRPGSLITVVLAGANRDPQVFSDPARFDVARPNAREHLSFSSGRHYCLGASLAKMEGEVGLRALTERFPDLELLPGAVRRSTRVLRGWQRLPALPLVQASTAP